MGKHFRLPVHNSCAWSRGWRSFTSVASEETKKQEEPPSQPPVSEDLNDEKLKIELEKLNKDITLQAEKNKELDVSICVPIYKLLTLAYIFASRVKISKKH